MSRREPACGDGLVAALAIRAMMEARWTAVDLLARRPPELAPDLLRAQAADLATSPAGEDQIMSLALEAAADDVERGAAPLGSGALFFFDKDADAGESFRLQREVLALPGESDERADDIVRTLEARHRREIGAASGFGELSDKLLTDAKLHKRLWDDPRLPADAATRRLMLCSVPRLIDRARVLDPMRLRSVRSVLKLARARAMSDA